MVMQMEQESTLEWPAYTADGGPGGMMELSGDGCSVDPSEQKTTSQHPPII